jgi:hypothetical protein
MSKSISVVAARDAKNQRAAVDADLLQQLVEGDELAGAFAHRDLDAVADEADPGVEQHLDLRPGRSPSPRRRSCSALPSRGGRPPRCR